jgi:hypothetical protein
VEDHPSRRYSCCSGHAKQIATTIRRSQKLDLSHFFAPFSALSPFLLPFSAPLAGGVVPFAAPLQLTPDFQGENLPMTLRPGMGGVIIGPRDGGLNRATDITFGLLASGSR